jgi:hypothetical protein
VPYETLFLLHYFVFVHASGVALVNLSLLFCTAGVAEAWAKRNNRGERGPHKYEQREIIEERGGSQDISLVKSSVMRPSLSSVISLCTC